MLPRHACKQEVQLAHRGSQGRGACIPGANICGSLAQVGFGGWATSSYRQLPYGNQRVAASSSVAAIGQPLATARTATQAAVLCEVLVQPSGNPYQCSLGYCSSIGLYFKNW